MTALRLSVRARWTVVWCALLSLLTTYETSSLYAQAPDAVDSRIKDRLSQIDRLNATRSTLMADYERLTTEQRELYEKALVKQEEGKSLSMQLAGVQARLGDTQATILNLQGALADLNADTKTPNRPALQQQLVLQINQLSNQANQLRAQAGALETQIRKLRVEIDGLERQHQQKEQNKTTIRVKADLAWAEWKELVDPLGLLTRREHEASIERLTDAIGKDPTHGGAFLARAAAYQRLGQSPAAIKDLSQAVQIGQPFLVTALAMRGRLLMEADRAREGQADFAQAYKLDKKNSDMYLLRGLALAAQGKFPLAEKDFRLAAQLGAGVQGNRLIALRLVTTDEKTHDTKQAIELAKKAVELSKRLDWSCYDALAAAYAEAGDWEEAVAAARQAADLTSDDHRQRCLERAELYEQKKPLRLAWK